MNPGRKVWQAQSSSIFRSPAESAFWSPSVLCSATFSTNSRASAHSSASLSLSTVSFLLFNQLISNGFVVLDAVVLPPPDAAAASPALEVDSGGMIEASSRA